MTPSVCDVIVFKCSQQLHRGDMGKKSVPSLILTLGQLHTECTSTGHVRDKWHCFLHWSVQSCDCVPCFHSVKCREAGGACEDIVFVQSLKHQIRAPTRHTFHSHTLPDPPLLFPSLIQVFHPVSLFRLLPSPTGLLYPSLFLYLAQANKSTSLCFRWHLVSKLYQLRGVLSPHHHQHLLHWGPFRTQNRKVCVCHTGCWETPNWLTPVFYLRFFITKERIYDSIKCIYDVLKRWICLCRRDF